MSNVVEIKDYYNKELKDWQKKYGFTSPAEKVKIYYSSAAFAKTVQLVKAHPMEIAWNMMVKPYKDGYKVYDIFVYPQSVNPAHVSVDVAKAWGFWKAGLDDEVEANLYGQGHSHVNMSTFKSVVDENQQHDEILSKGRGFYLFQIWNKHNEINSFFYDIDNKIYYEKDDIEMIVENVDDFVMNSFRMIFGERKGKYEEGEDF
jgi:hypothetical protein